MKKTIALILIAALLISLTAVIAYNAGHREGFRHAIEDSTHWILSWEEHEDYDFDLFIDIDGNCYQTALFVG